MKAVMLAGDCGYGRCPLATAVPKGLWPVLDQPAAADLIHHLTALGAEHIGVCANGDSSLFAEALDGSVRDAAALTFFEDTLPRGAAGCVADVASKLGRGRFLVLQTNILWDARLAQILRRHLHSKADLTVVVTPDSTDASLRPAGIYIFEPCVFDFIQPSSYQDIKEQLIPSMIKAGRCVKALVLPEGPVAWRDATTYLAVLGRALACPQRFGLPVASMREVAPSIYVAPDAQVSSSARIVGPVAILSGACIEADAVLIGPAVVGPDSRVGRSALVSESILWSAATIENGSYVTGSVIGHGAVVAATAMNCVVMPSRREPRWRRWHDETVQPSLRQAPWGIARKRCSDPGELSPIAAGADRGI
jgi:NDP-sugar pyrophosphorylase family protein